MNSSRFQKTLPAWVLVAMTILFTSPAQAQWKTENIELLPGWNGVYLHVDASHDTIANIVAGTPITEIWLWRQDLSNLQFVDSPLASIESNSRFLVWRKDAPVDSTLTQLIGNAAYLVRVDDALPGDATSYTWSLKGKPVPPKYAWSSSGLNFHGFSTVDTGAPDLERFFTPEPALLQADVYRYLGGDITNNPAMIYALRSVEASRGRAFWIRETNSYVRYFGPIDLELQSASGVHFGELSSSHRLRLKNPTDEVLTVTLNQAASENPPAGETAIVGQPEILIRGAINLATLTYDFSRLSAGAYSWTLQPEGEEGDEVDVVLGLDRSQMTGAADSLYAGILRFTDSKGFMQVDVPVSAVKIDMSGLWVGQAEVTQVRHELSFYDRSGETNVLTGTDNSLGPVQRAFPLRLIVHVAANGTARLLQRVFTGFDESGLPILSRNQAALNPDYYASSRRISAVHLPYTENNTAWTFASSTGSVEAGANLTTSVAFGPDSHISNPFLHTYHPDHDNRDATFSSTLARGIESYRVQRSISMTVGTSTNSFTELTSAGRTLTGTYGESIEVRARGAEGKTFQTAGTFSLTRLTAHPQLLNP